MLIALIIALICVGLFVGELIISDIKQKTKEVDNENHNRTGNEITVERKDKD